MWLIHIENSFSQNGILLFLGHSIIDPSDSTTNLSEYQQLLPYGPCQAIGNNICYPGGSARPMRWWQKMYESVRKLYSSMITWQHSTSGPVPELDTDTNLIHNSWINSLTHWGRVTHICVIKLTIIGLDNGLSPDRRQAIIWTNTGLLLIGPLGTNFSEILIEILTF